jgi:hypothetical protein
VRTDRKWDPMPPGGICEWLYPRLRVLDGAWHPWFLEQVKAFYGGKIPERFQRVASAYHTARERAAQADRDDDTARNPGRAEQDPRGESGAK